MPSSDKQSAFTIFVRFLPAIAWMGLIFTLSHQPTLPKVPGMAASLTSILGHFLVYFVLAVVLWWTLGAFELSPSQRILLAFGGALLYGFSDEWHQSFVPGRDPSLMDNVIDAIGAATGLAIAHGLRQSGLLPKRWM